MSTRIIKDDNTGGYVIAIDNDSGKHIIPINLNDILAPKDVLLQYPSPRKGVKTYLYTSLEGENSLLIETIITDINFRSSFDMSLKDNKIEFIYNGLNVCKGRPEFTFKLNVGNTAGMNPYNYLYMITVLDGNLRHRNSYLMYVDGYGKVWHPNLPNVYLGLKMCLGDFTIADPSFFGIYEAIVNQFNFGFNNQDLVSSMAEAQALLKWDSDGKHIGIPFKNHVRKVTDHELPQSVMKWMKHRSYSFAV